MPGSRPIGPAPPRGRREYRKRLTRRELISAGRRLFGKQGLYESRIEDLTSLAGVAKGTLYGYFSSKEALIEAVVTAGLDEMLLHVASRAEAARTRRDRTAAVVTAHLEFMAANPDLVRILHQVRGLLKFGRRKWQPLRRALESYLDGLARVLTLNGRGGRRPGKPARDLARVLFGAISGVTSLHVVLARRSPPPRVTPTATRSLVALALSHERRNGAARAGSAARRRRRPAGKPARRT